VAASAVVASEGDGFPLGTHIRTAAYFIPIQSVLADIREVSEHIGRSPRTSEYTRERQRIYEETLAAGRPRALASYPTIHRHFLEWDDALVAAGLEPLGGRATGRKKSNRQETPCI
jgi:hypothetical protein